MRNNTLFTKGTLAKLSVIALMFTVMALAACSGKANAQAGGGDSKSASAPKASGKEAPASDFAYDLSEDSKGVVITKYTGKGGKLVIPAQIEGLPVVQLGGILFRNNESLTSVVIPASVKTVKHWAFSNCERLTSVTFLGTGVELGPQSFSSCTELSEVKFPDAENALIPIIEEWEMSVKQRINGQETGKWVAEKTRGNGDSAFYGCKKLPLAVRAKLQAMGFTDI